MTNKISRRRSALLFTAIAFLALPLLARADDILWTAPAGGLWSNPDNWSPFPPSPNDNVYNSLPNSTVTLDTDATVASFSSDSSELDVAAQFNGNFLTVNNTLVIDGGGLNNFQVIQTDRGSITYSSNSNNSLSNVTFYADITGSSNSYMQLFNRPSLDATWNLANTTGGIQLHDSTTLFSINFDGTLRGYGTVSEASPGSHLFNSGLISADANNQSITLAISDIEGHGTYEAKNGGTLVISGTLNGASADVHADTGIVLVDGGTLTGNFESATGTGFTFSSNAANALLHVDISGNITLTTNAYVQIQGSNVVHGVLTLSTTSNGIQFQDNSAGLIIDDGALLHGYGTFSSKSSGGEILSVGTIAADVPGQTLTLNQANTDTGGQITVAKSATLAIGGKLTQHTGTTSVDGTLKLTNPFTLIEGLLNGNGTISGNVVNSGAIVSPGHSPGLLTINGNYEQDASAFLHIELAGHIPGTTYDQLDTVTASLDGTLDVNAVDGFIPSIGDIFDILSYDSHTGTFTTLTSDTGLTYHVDYLPNAAQVTIDAINPVPEPATLLLLTLPLLLRRKRK